MWQSGRPSTQQPPPPVSNLIAWVATNRTRLVAKFSREYGGQIQEWSDFVEAEFAKASAANQPPKTK